jgi:hypothetical protein
MQKAMNNLPGGKSAQGIYWEPSPLVTEVSFFPPSLASSKALTPRGDLL